MVVLDVGCGSGAITRDIADAVGPTGKVVGVDLNDQLLAMAANHARLRAKLTFELGDATAR
jgi:ubiquinone/menaquinone biosynthesis C-methylase UbiE